MSCDGVILIAVVGEDASRIHEIIVQDGSDPSRFIATSLHTVEEVQEFVRFCEHERNQAVQLVKLWRATGRAY